MLLIKFSVPCRSLIAAIPEETSNPRKMPSCSCNRGVVGEGESLIFCGKCRERPPFLTQTQTDDRMTSPLVLGQYAEIENCEL